VIADDGLRRSQLLRVLQRNADIAVVGQATGAAGVVDLLAQTDTDVVILDLDLCDGSGQAAVEEIMSRAPRPILVLSTAVERADGPSAALAAGAVAVVPVPPQWTTEAGADLRHTTHQVSKVHVVRHARGGQPRAAARIAAAAPGLGATTRPPGQASGRTPPQATPSHDVPSRPVVGLAASTGGPAALAIVLAGLAGLAAPVLVVQHLHADFTNGLIEWMSRASSLPVAAAVHGQAARPGWVYLAPAGVHLRLGAAGRLELTAIPVSLHCPSADQLFLSMSERAGRDGVGVVLTGMGDDGAAGLLALRRQGGRTLGQDEESCAVFGMPHAAQLAGAVTNLLPLSQVAPAIQRAVSEVLR